MECDKQIASLQGLVCLCSGASECEVKKEPAKVESVAVGGVLPLASVPPCHVGCTESLLGFLNTQQEKGVEDLLKVNSIKLFLTSLLNPSTV